MHCSRSQSSYKGVMHSSNWKSANLISCHLTLSEQQQQHLFLPAAPLIHPVLSCDSLPRGKGSTMVPASYAACPTPPFVSRQSQPCKTQIGFSHKCCSSVRDTLARTCAGRGKLNVGIIWPGLDATTRRRDTCVRCCCGAAPDGAF